METQALFLLIENIKQARKSEHDIELVTNFASLIKAIHLSYAANWES